MKKRKKSKKQRGKTTYGHGARQKWKGKGHRGGVGMAGSGKRGDQKKSLITKLYGKKYFGKQGITSRGTKRKKEKIVNLRDIKSDKKEVTLIGYKVLGEGNLEKDITIKARAFTTSAKEKIEKAGGKAIEVNKKGEEKVKKSSKKNSKKKDSKKKSEDSKKKSKKNYKP